MRVTHVITRLITGGAQENTIATVEGLRVRPDFDVQLISGPTTGSEGSLEPTVAKVPGLLRVVPELVRPVHPLKDILAYRALIRLFRVNQPDVVHTHSGKAGVLGRLAASKASVPLIIHTIHGPSFGRFQGNVANAVFLAAERRAGRVTDHFVSVADAMTDQYLAAGIGTRSQYSCIRSGFDVTPFQEATSDLTLRRELGFNAQDIVVGMVSRLAPLKGHHDMLEAAVQLVRDHPRLRLLFVGDGRLRAQIESRVERFGLKDRVRFTGLVPPTDIPKLIGIMNVVAHLSRREGLPRAVAQALAAGKPVVAYDCDGAGEICVEGETGFLVEPGDLNTLSNRLEMLLLDRGLRVRLGRRGARLAARMFSVTTMVEQICELYLTLSERLKQ
jgi:glycosyltransferase involved in cell wall biosynthesis